MTLIGFSNPENPSPFTSKQLALEQALKEYINLIIFVLYYLIILVYSKTIIHLSVSG